MAKPAVLLIGDLVHTNKEWQALASKYNLKEFRSGSRDEFLEKLKAGEYHDVTGLYRSNTSVSETGPFDAELISLLPEALKYICHNGAGYDNIDVNACNERRIHVSSTPVAVDDATADIAIFLMLGALRQAHISYQALKQGKWRGNAPLGHDPKGKVLGIMGMGGIGKAVAKRARGFGMSIVYHNRSRLYADLEGGAEYVSFSDLLARSDVLSLNLALNADTKHIISAPQLAKCKKGVTIINTARGGLIKESDLVNALESGHVGAVGLDVFEEEPKIHPGLTKNDKAFLMPHMGTWTYETQRDMEMLVLQNLESGIDHGKLLTRINEQKGLPWAQDGSSKVQQRGSKL